MTRATRKLWQLAKHSASDAAPFVVSQGIPSQISSVGIEAAPSGRSAQDLRKTLSSPTQSIPAKILASDLPSPATFRAHGALSCVGSRQRPVDSTNDLLRWQNSQSIIRWLGPAAARGPASAFAIVGGVTRGLASAAGEGGNGGREGGGEEAGRDGGAHDPQHQAAEEAGGVAATAEEQPPAVVEESEPQDPVVAQLAADVASMGRLRKRMRFPAYSDEIEDEVEQAGEPVDPREAPHLYDAMSLVERWMDREEEEEQWGPEDEAQLRALQEALFSAGGGAEAEGEEGGEGGTEQPESAEQLVSSLVGDPAGAAEGQEADDRPSAELRWETRMVMGPGGDAWHPANRKVKVSLFVRELQLTPLARERLLALVGPRYNARKDELTLVSERFRFREENRKDVFRILHELVAEAKKADEYARESSGQGNGEPRRAVG